MNKPTAPAQFTETQQRALATIATDHEYVRAHVSKPAAQPSQATRELLANLTRHDVPDWML